MVICEQSLLYVVVFVFLISDERVQSVSLFFFLMIRRPPRSTLDRSSAASDVYKRQEYTVGRPRRRCADSCGHGIPSINFNKMTRSGSRSVSYTHLRAHETVLYLVCRLLLETKKKHQHKYISRIKR